MTASNDFDIAVIGLGGVGSAATWRAAARGARVIGIEQYALAHSRGSSHGGSRIFRRTLFEGAAYIPLVDRAAGLWRELEDGSGTTLFKRSGGLCIGLRDGDLIGAALESARTGGFEHELLEPDDLARQYPQHADTSDEVAVFEPGAGSLDPERCVRAAVELAEAAGAQLALETKVTSIAHDDAGATVELGADRIRARRLIVATGAWFTDLLPDLTLPLRAQRSPQVWFTGDDMEAYRPDRFPAFVRKRGDLDGWGLPDVDGLGVKLGVGPSVPKPWLDHADDNVRPIDASDTAPSEAFVAAAFPELRPAASMANPCMNSRTPDRDFVIGVPRSAPSLVLAGGFSGHGFKHASASGDVCVDLALEGASDIPLERFSPDRFTGQEW